MGERVRTRKAPWWVYANDVLMALNIYLWLKVGNPYGVFAVLNFVVLVVWAVTVAFRSPPLPPPASE